MTELNGARDSRRDDRSILSSDMLGFVAIAGVSDSGAGKAVREPTCYS